jgi:hypothetical protein
MPQSPLATLVDYAALDMLIELAGATEVPGSALRLRRWRIEVAALAGSRPLGH